MSGQGYVQYRCRRCHEVDNAIHAPDVDSAIIDLVVHGKVKGDGVPVHLVHSHHCKDGGVGLSDCIGVHAYDKRVETPVLEPGWALLSHKHEGGRLTVLTAAHADVAGGCIVFWAWTRDDEGEGWAVLRVTTDSHWRRDQVPLQPPFWKGP